ncbi:cysteine desulfurase [Rhizobiales bacterium GAS191]|nr:cysteine desulfurase [Rhizobiales bacterium GAS113]SEE18306.1 cysteine desulfurase [Rhizobiales bacterium GAS191]SEE37296.1 cysteine desulfurase [Rhizobiales bacterium GAS188]
MTVHVASAPYDLNRVRSDFPILSQKVYGHPLVYLDNGASAQKPRQVMDAMRELMETGYSNVHRGLHYMANASTEAFEAAREKTRAFINAESTDEIIFTRSVTGAINLVASSYGGTEIKPGDEIVLSIMEHHSNIVPWHYHRERNGAVIKWAGVDDDGVFDLDGFAKLLTPRTKMVAITHMSNVLGTVTPLKEIVALAHARGIPVLADGAQAVVHLPVDVRDLDIDFYGFTGHKLYGPTGIGVLYAKRKWLDRMRPYEGGGEMIAEVTTDTITYNDPPHKFEAGTPPIVQAVGLGAAIDYVTALGKDKIRAHEEALRDHAHHVLSRMNSIRIIGNAPGKGAIVSFEMKGAHAHDVATVIDRAGVAVRAGTHCAMPLLTRFGTTSTCRASFGLYNTHEEVDMLAQALRKAETLFA